MSAYPDYLTSEGAMTVENYKLPMRHGRELKISAPLVMTPAELERIQKWIALQFIIKTRLTPGEVNFGDFIGA